MRVENLKICQQLLNQTRSIDEAARLMCEHRDVHEGFRYWQEQIINHVEDGDLII